MIKGGDDANGHGVALAVSTALAGGMGFRAFKTKKMMPAGAVATLGLITALYSGNQYRQWK
jgi:uncharacterized membrane protein (UPF0136 family)